MAWPLVSINDVISLSKPFDKKRNFAASGQKKIQGFIYFDIGSVLIDLNWDFFYEKLSQLFTSTHKFSIEKFLTLSKNENLNSLWSQGKISTQDYIEDIINLLMASCENNDNFNISSLQLKHVDSFILSQHRSLVLQFIQKLKQKGYAVGLLSNTTPWHLNLLYEKLKVTENFDVSIFSPDVGFEKPSIEIYEEAQKQAAQFIENHFEYKLMKNDIYFVDDTPANVVQAQKYGWNARLVNLINDAILNKLKLNQITEDEFQQASQKKENLLFEEEASKRVIEIFGNLI